MAFLITRDHLAEQEPADEVGAAGTNLNAVGVTGPRDATEAEVAQLKAGLGRTFRMFDDDSELYYEGRWIEGAERMERGLFGIFMVESDELEPLDCFGTPNAGCTYIEYQNANGEWEAI